MWDDGEKKTPKNIIILSTKLKIKSTPSQFFFFLRMLSCFTLLLKMTVMTPLSIGKSETQYRNITMVDLIFMIPIMGYTWGLAIFVIAFHWWVISIPILKVKEKVRKWTVHTTKEGPSQGYTQGCLPSRYTVSHHVKTKITENLFHIQLLFVLYLNTISSLHTNLPTTLPVFSCTHFKLFALYFCWVFPCSLFLLILFLTLPLQKPNQTDKSHI